MTASIADDSKRVRVRKPQRNARIGLAFWEYSGAPVPGGRVDLRSGSGMHLPLRPQPRRSAHAAGVTVCWGKNGSRGSASETVSLEQRRNILVEPVEPGKPASNHDHVRIDHMHDGSIVPWAVGLHTGAPELLRIEVRIYGDSSLAFRAPDSVGGLELTWKSAKGKGQPVMRKTRTFKP